ncbi:MAG: SCO family protein [Pseudomonadota bacterium]
MNAARSRGQLLDFLKNNHSDLQGLPARDVHRLRAIVFTRLAKGTAEPELLEEIQSELELGDDLHAACAAASALSKLAKPGLDSPVWLLCSLNRFAHADRLVDIENPFSSTPNRHSGVSKLIEAYCGLPEAVRAKHKTVWLDWLGRNGVRLKTSDLERLENACNLQDSPCCASVEVGRNEENLNPLPLPVLPNSVLSAVVQDQSGRQEQFSGVFLGKVSLLVFFYTRCMNPAKCARTIAGLVKIRKELTRRALDQRFGLFAVTYDPEWDTDARLVQYGRERSFPFDDDTRFIRFTRHWSDVVTEMELSVGFGGGSVNRHGTDMFIVGPDGQPLLRWPNRSWSEDQILNTLIDNANQNS